MQGRTRYRAPLSVLLSALVVACASGPEVQSDYDRTADFSRYRTFQVMGSDARRADENYSSLIEQRVIDAIEREMQSRGYRPATDPDLLVNFDLTVEAKVSATSVSLPPGHQPSGYYGYRSGYYRAWNAYTTETRVRHYEEGTLIIDLVDAAAKTMIWEGVAQGTVTQKVRDNPEEAINTAVAAIFAEYPSTAR